MTSDSLSQAFRRILPVSSHSPYCRVVAHSSLRPSITAYEISTGKILNHKLCLRYVRLLYLIYYTLQYRLFYLISFITRNYLLLRIFTVIYCITYLPYYYLL